MASLTAAKHAPFVHLDLIRGLAALLVFAGHLRRLLLVDHVDIIDSGPGFWLLYFVTDFGFEAVLVFFVLSGFLISRSVIGSLLAQTWSWRAYALSRLSRLYAVLVPALCLGAIFDTGTVLWARLAGLPPPALFGFSAVAFFGNLSFLQGIVVMPFGSNISLWSLSYEFWYYVIFPCLAIALLGAGHSRWQRIVLALVGSCLLLGFGRRMAFYFLIWGLGVLVGQLPLLGRIGLARVVTGFGTAAFLSSLALRGTGRLFAGPTTHAIEALGFAILLWGLVSLPQPATSSPYGQAASGIAGFSYSLYLLHYPVVFFLAQLLVGTTRWQPTPLLLLATGSVVALVLLYCYGVARVTEHRTSSLRRRMQRFLGVGTGP